MWFLIGVLILIAFIVFSYIYIRIRLKKYFGSDIGEIIKEARLEDEELPKSLSSMDSIYLERIKKDFPDVNINELKSLCEKEILDIFNSVENKNVKSIKGKMKSLVESMIEDNRNKDISYQDIKFHKTVVSKYENNNSIATITFGSSFQYILNEGSKTKKVQDRAKIEFIYVIDANKVDYKKKVLGINCPNCGAPIKKLGNKSCSYCGSHIIDIVKKVWTINDVKFY